MSLPDYVSRSGHKLATALDAFGVNVGGAICADFGCNVGGFTDCLLQRGAARVYAIDTGYGVLAYKLRKDRRVVVRERTNAMHVELPEQVNLVAIDVAWTPQRHILPNAVRALAPDGRIITLIKPHYEATRQQIHAGVLDPSALPLVLGQTRQSIADLKLRIEGEVQSPFPGHKGNIEFLFLLAPLPT